MIQRQIQRQIQKKKQKNILWHQRPPSCPLCRSEFLPAITNTTALKALYLAGGISAHVLLTLARAAQAVSIYLAVSGGRTMPSEDEDVDQTGNDYDYDEGGSFNMYDEDYEQEEPNALTDFDISDEAGVTGKPTEERKPKPRPLPPYVPQPMSQVEKKRRMFEKVDKGYKMEAALRAKQKTETAEAASPPEESSPMLDIDAERVAPHAPAPKRRRSMFVGEAPVPLSLEEIEQASANRLAQAANPQKTEQSEDETDDWERPENYFGTFREKDVLPNNPIDPDRQRWWRQNMNAQIRQNEALEADKRRVRLQQISPTYAPPTKTTMFGNSGEGGYDSGEKIPWSSDDEEVNANAHASFCDLALWA